MDFGLKIGFSLKEKLNSFSVADLEHLQNKIEEAIFDVCEEEGLTYAQTMTYEDSYLINLYPEEQEVEMHSTEDQYLICTASSSSAGPGYHAFLIHVLNNIAKECHLTWQWEGTDHGFYCDGTYHLDQDFDKLQHDMADILVNCAKNIIKNDMRNIRLTMPEDCPVVHDKFAVSPIGYWERDYFEKLSNTDLTAQEKLTLAADFFPWWEQEVNALFWCKLGVCLMNISVPWRPIRDKTDPGFLYCVLALRAFEAAQELDPTLPVPIEEIEELDALLHHAAIQDFDVIPDAEGLGFRRSKLQHTIEEQWQIEVPGFFYSFVDTPEETAEDIASTLIFYYNDIMIECKIYQINLEEGQHITDFIYHDTEANLINEYRDNEIAFLITKEESINKDGVELTIFNAEYGYKNQVFVVTVSHETKDDDNKVVEHDWIVHMLEAVDHVDLRQTPTERLNQR